MNYLLGNQPIGGDDTPTHSIEQGIRKLLTDHLSIPVQTRRTQTQAYPVIISSKEESTYGDYLDRKDGTGEATFELTIWHEDYDELAPIAKAIRTVIDHFGGMAWDRKVTCSILDNETDHLQTKGDGSQNIIYGRTQTYKVDFVEP